MLTPAICPEVKLEKSGRKARVSPPVNWNLRQLVCLGERERVVRRGWGGLGLDQLLCVVWRCGVLPVLADWQQVWSLCHTDSLAQSYSLTIILPLQV